MTQPKTWEGGESRGCCRFGEIGRQSTQLSPLPSRSLWYYHEGISCRWNWVLSHLTQKVWLPPHWFLSEFQIPQPPQSKPNWLFLSLLVVALNFKVTEHALSFLVPRSFFLLFPLSLSTSFPSYSWWKATTYTRVIHVSFFWSYWPWFCISLVETSPPLLALLLWQVYFHFFSSLCVCS